MSGEVQQRFWIRAPDNSWSVVIDRGKRVSTLGLHWNDKLYPTHVFEVPTAKLIQYLTDGTFKAKPKTDPNWEVTK